MSAVQVGVSRAWGQPTLKTVITQEGISIKLNLDAFILALQQEVQLPPLKFQSKKAKAEKEEFLRVAVGAAVLRIIERMKVESSRATHH